MILSRPPRYLTSVNGLEGTSYFIIGEVPIIVYSHIELRVKTHGALLIWQVLLSVSWAKYIHHDHPPPYKICPLPAQIVLIMCGLDTSTAVRVGARVDLFHESRGHWGSMVFMNPTVPESTTATHVRFTSASAEPISMRHKSQMLVSIQYVVNLQPSVNECNGTDNRQT
jgi:hypothetical protein